VTVVDARDADRDDDRNRPEARADDGAEPRPNRATRP